MKRFAAHSFLILAAALMAEGCNTKGDARSKAGGADQAGNDELAQAAEQAAQAAGSVLTDDRAALTPDEYERLMLELATCDIKGESIDPQCPARKAWTEARTRSTMLADLGGLTATLGKKHIKHHSPAVRIQAAAFLGSIFGADPSSRTTIIAAARSEKEQAVLVSMIQTVGSKGAANPEIGTLLLEMADHEIPSVRKKAVVWLGSSWNNGLPGSIEKLSEKIESDPDMEVREFACKYSGTRADDQLVALYDKHTKDPGKEPTLYRACMEGLLNAWLNYPLLKTYNRKAYELTLVRLAQKPRSKDAPPWVLLDRFAELAKESSKSVVEWKAQATWFKPKALLAALESVVVDPDAYSMARTGALKSMVALGAPKKQLEKMRAAYKSSEAFEDKGVVSELDQAIAAAR